MFLHHTLEGCCCCALQPTVDTITPRRLLHCWVAAPTAGGSVGVSATAVAGDVASGVSSADVQLLLQGAAHFLTLCGLLYCCGAAAGGGVYVPVAAVVAAGAGTADSKMLCRRGTDSTGVGAAAAVLAVGVSAEHMLPYQGGKGGNASCCQ